ncbi:hypothetical protein MNBD_GAMMA12-3128 [hydrothermal vent metagenome]|uniref:Uncharacterized protein n=1 Tax=hydrothermal vent metagenome TaxID=652676 RepID=A0A3B0YVC9_9ZZZZ
MSDKNKSPHSPLVRYLRVTDHDALELVFVEIPDLAPSEVLFIEKILNDWTEEQAIANLLFYPSLIPKSIRFDIICKALTSDNAPYYVLAATVGLQLLKASDWTAEQRDKIGERLILIASQNVEIIAARASITVWEYLDGLGDVQLLGVYPVATSTANRNIMAYVLTRYADYSKKEFKQALKKMAIKWHIRRKFVKRFKRCLRGKRSGKAVFMQAPEYIDIPSLTDVDQRVFVQASQE